MSNEELVGDMVVCVSSGNKIVQFSILRGVRTLDFRTADHGLFRELVVRILWEAAM